MELEEAIEICKRRTNILKLKYAITNEDLEAIETVLQALENKNKEIDKLNKIGFKYSKKCGQLDCRYNKLQESSIPKKVIEDTIKELEREEKDCKTSILKMQYLCKINILQEILKEGK